MSDFELEALRRKRLRNLRRQVEIKENVTEPKKSEKKEVDFRKVLNRFFVGRAWEVLNAAKYQHPQVATYVERMLVKLIREGKIRNQISGEELYGLFRRLGFRVRLQTHIRVLEHGKIKSLEDKIKEETS